MKLHPVDPITRGRRHDHMEADDDGEGDKGDDKKSRQSCWIRRCLMTKGRI